LSQDRQPGGVLQYPLPYVVALGDHREMHQKRPHLVLVERTEIVHLEMVVEGRTVILRLSRRARACSHYNGAAGPHEQFPETVLLAVLETFENQLKIVDQQYRALAAGFCGGLEGVVHLVRKGLIVFCRADCGCREPRDRRIDFVGLSGLLCCFARIGQRIEAVQPEFGKAVHGVLLFGKHEWNEPARQPRIFAQFGSNAREQHRLAHAALADQQVMLRPAPRLFRREIGHDAIQLVSPRGESSDHLVRRHPAGVVKR
jgi:hypothetical protein